MAYSYCKRLGHRIQLTGGDLRKVGSKLDKIERPWAADELHVPAELNQ